MPIASYALPIAAFLAALSLTSWIRRLTVARRLLDVPNVRSSHSVATPRGGGVAIALSVLVALPMLGIVGAESWSAVCGYFGAGALIAIVGFVDDLGHVSPRWRLLAHFTAVGWVLWSLGGFPAIPLVGTFSMPAPARNVVAALYLVWLLNLTNFMDGIDGIASLETITASLGGAVLCSVEGSKSMGWLAPTVLAAATLGFLFWNWPPAKIFMGDTGSGFLGLMLGALSIEAAHAAPALFWGWVILLGVFIVDATLTLLHRLIRHERVYEAHRSHAYQHAATRWGHARVTIAVGLINICWLLPVAMLVTLQRIDGRTGVLIAYAPLTVAALLFRAGKPADA